MPQKLKLRIPPDLHVVDVVGRNDEHVRIVEAAFDSSVLVRGDEITLTGDDAPRAARVFEELFSLVSMALPLTEESVRRTVDMVVNESGSPTEVLGNTVLKVRGRPIRAKTPGQRAYVDAIEKSTVTFGIGPAGTGKTYLAVAMAVRALQNREVNRIVLTRPAVEAGERLGFLPGDIAAKVDPYLRPLNDALFEMLDAEAHARLADRGALEVAPLAYMRGRTLNDSFIIVDEAQNTSAEQMKMLLTRIGLRSKAVVTGDVTQIDLPTGQRSGLVAVRQVLRDIEGIAFVELGSTDVVRHSIVQKIVEAYEKAEG